MLQDSGQDGRLRWVALDAVGTLIYADPPVHVVYYNHARRCGSQLTPDEIRERFRQQFAAELQRAPWKTDESSEYSRWKRLVRSVLTDIPVEACFDALFEHFGNPRSWRCYPDAVRLLRTLRNAQTAVLLASNFDARLDSVCAGHPELSWIATRVISSQVGVRKPHPEFFQQVVQCACCPASQILMIGDDRHLDILPARKAGLLALHLDRQPAARCERTWALAAEVAGHDLKDARVLRQLAATENSITSLDSLIARRPIRRPDMGSRTDDE